MAEKNTGMVRPLDSMGRLVIPMETRKVLEIKPGHYLEFFHDQENEAIVLKVYDSGDICMFCGQPNHRKLFIFKGKTVCKSCAQEAGLASEVSAE